MVKAYVLIVAAPGATRRALFALRQIEAAVAVSEVMGPYDIVVELVLNEVTDIPSVVSDQIRSIEGIQSTTSLVAFPVQEQGDSVN